VGVRCTRRPWRRVKGAGKQRRPGIQRGQRGQAMADGPSTRCAATREAEVEDAGTKCWRRVQQWPVLVGSGQGAPQ
jgi:hypothetical protein